MKTITLPLGHSTRLGGPGFVIFIIALSLAYPISWLWRLVSVAVLLALGTWLWSRYLRRRPVRLNIEAGGGLSAVLSDGSLIEVSRILPGVIRPYLLSARLEGRAGERVDLLVPGGSLPKTAHWQLRRAVTQFRSGGDGEAA